MRAEPLRLLLLEDNEGDALLVQTALAGGAPGEFTIATVERLADALACIQSECFDVALCDLGLPDSSGLDTAQKLIVAAPELPLVVLTGTHTAELGPRAIALGAQDFLVKGDFQAPTLARALRYAIERKRLENALIAAYSTLEQRVSERTADLELVNRVLRASAERYQAVTQTATDAIISVDALGLIENWNAGATRLFGYEQVEAVGQPLTLLIPQRLRDRHLTGMKRVQSGGERHAIGRTVEMVGLRKDASEFPIELSLSEWQIAGQQHFTGTIRDISERKAQEQLLIESENKLQAILNQSPSFVYVLDLSGRFTLVNQRLAALFGQPSSAILGNTRETFLPKEITEQHHANDLEIQRTGEPTTFEENTNGPEGKRTYLSIKFPLRDLKGAITAVCGISTDITEKKLAEDEIKSQLAQLEAAFKGTVEVATTLSEMRDPYTAGHERRVGKLASAIGAELGLDAHRVEGLGVAGYLHDIGKITVPAEILSKPGRLSPPEYQLIQAHAQAGYEVLKSVQFPWPLAEVALQHHERLDGSGYPQGLKGDAILLEARIMAVADVVEAIASHRPYRAALGIEAALAEIESGSASKYEPGVVQACLKLFREKDYVLTT